MTPKYYQHPDCHKKIVSLVEHPEGGRFHEIFRSDAVATANGGQARAALTHIYFSLDKGEVSRFHRVHSDEVWNLYQGSGIRLYTWDGTNRPPTCIELSAQAGCFCHVVHAGIWQAAEPVEDSVLVGCSVAPGFEFQNFEMMATDSDEARRLQAGNPAMSKFILP